MLRPEHPGIANCIILVKNPFRETVRIIENNMSAVNLHHQTSTIQNEGPVLFLIQDPCLFRRIVVYNLSDLHAVLRCQMIITADHIRTGFFCFIQKLFIKICAHPIVRINKPDPVSLCSRQSQVLRTALLPVIGRGNHNHLTWVLLFIILQNGQGIIRGTVIHCNDLVIRNRLSDQRIHTPFQFIICCHIKNRDYDA